MVDGETLYILAISHPQTPFFNIFNTSTTSHSLSFDVLTRSPLI
jgi:hypothetical protein